MPRPLIQDIVKKKKNIQPQEHIRKPQAEEIKEEKKSAFAEALEESIGESGIKEKQKRKRIFKFPRFKFPAFFSASKAKILWSLIVVGLAAFAALVILNRFSSVTVEIKPRQEFVDVNTDLRASVQPKTGELSLEIMKLSYKESGSVKTTETKQVSRKASGQIMVYNAYSSQPQILVANTRFEEQAGKIYRIDKQITVPAAKTVEGKLVAGEIEATVFADKAGEEYNIGLTDFKIPGFKDPVKLEKIYGRSKTEMKGGFIGEAKVANAADIKNLESLLEAKVKDYLLKMAVNPKPDIFVLYDNAKQIIFDKSAEPKAGTETEQLEMGKSAALSGFLLKKDDVSRVLGEKYFDSETASKIELINADKLTFELKNYTATNITFNLKGQARFAWKLHEDNIKKDLINESKNQSAVFQKYPAIERARITFKPSWWHYMPKDISRINIQKNLEALTF